MFKRSQWLGTAALLFAAGIVASFLHQRSVDAERRATTEAHRAEQIEAEVAELRRELHAVQARDLLGRQKGASGPPVLSNVVTSTAPAAVPSVVAEPVSTPTKKALTSEDIRDGLNVHFYGETVDSSWSRTARQAFQARLIDALPAGSKLGSVECKSSMCRAEIWHPDLEAHREFIRTGFSSPTKPWQAATNVTLGEKPDSGKVTSIVFLAREGHEIPYDQDTL